ncbi:hypothetical protein Enr13x_07630 [Stieleria neptunia]|uniref:Uncharacterized protein n=1 Tax=Stieleria neptunia TaxID=2527979 RepID=A0A518HJ95_9BACT|nr:hypothetical protein [Stieleria neptunia]QDV40925.1 hypothetical protein Enr13x_07630 [Stieleria neptunia]
MTIQHSDEDDHGRNPFQPPSAMDTGRQRRSMVYLFACLLWCGLAIKIMVLRPIMRSIFEDFEVELPGLTRWLLHPGFSALVLFIAVGLVSARLFLAASETRRRIGGYAVVLALVLLGLVVIGFGLPLLSLMQALS